MISYFQAIVIGLLQGSHRAVPHLQPRAVRAPTRLAALEHHRRRPIRDERLAWLIIVALIPVGVIGLALEHTLRTVFAKPLAAAIFLTVNGVLLAGGEWVRRRSETVRRLAATQPRPPRSWHRRNAEPDDGGPDDASTPSSCARPASSASPNPRRCSPGSPDRASHDRRADPRARSRRRRPVLVPARHPRHPRRRALQGPRPRRSPRPRCTRPSPRRRHRGRHRCVRLRAVPRPVLQDRNLLPFAVYCLAAGGISLIRFH